MSGALKNSLLWAAVVLPTLLLLLFKTPGIGTDNQAQGVIQEIAPDYQPWFESLFIPPSDKSESLLFALQAALGAGVIGYYVRSVRRKRAVIPPANVSDRAH